MKKQSMWLRIIVLMLSLCMLVSVFAACATEDEDSTDGATSGGDESSGDQIITEEEFENSDFSKTVYYFK